MPGGPDRLVGLLGVLDLGLIYPRAVGQVLRAVLAGDDLPRRLDGHAGQRRRVGAHVGDMAVFVKALGHLHRPPRGEAVLAVGLLLQRAGGEGRIGLGGVRLVFQFGDAGRLALQPCRQVRGLLLIQEQAARVFQLPGGRIEVAASRNPPAVDRYQRGLECLPAPLRGRHGLGERAQQVPVGGRAKGHPLPFALDDQPHGHALHPPRREPRANLPPQQRRNVITIEPIDNPPDFLRADQGLVDRAWLFQGVANRFFGDLMEHQPMDRNLRLEHLTKVPANGLALAVFVSCQVKVLGVFQGRPQLSHLLGLLRRDDINRFEAVINVHAQIGPLLFLILLWHFLGAVGQIADVAYAGLDRVAAAEEAADRPGLGRRFDDYQRRGGIGRFFGHVKLGKMTRFVWGRCCCLSAIHPMIRESAAIAIVVFCSKMVDSLHLIEKVLTTHG